MSIVSLNTLKGYFETGKKPTQQQFANLIDTLLANGTVTLPAGTTSYDLPEDTFITSIVFKCDLIESEYVSVGITEEGIEIIDNEEISGEKGVFPVHYYCEVARTIYFTGVPEDAIIKLYIK